jgi:putative ABC transport system substrate-binding protein
MIDRRTFLTLLGAGTFAAPLAARAQQTRMVRIGWLDPESRPDALNPFRQTMKELGWVAGGTFAIEQRSAHGEVERYPELAAELVRLKVDVLVTDGSPATKAAQKATTTIPIVFVSGNPIRQGFVASLGRPGGNLTGVAIFAGDLNPKRIELLRQAVPGLARLATLEDQSGSRLAPSDAENWQAIEAASRQLGIQLMPARGVRKLDDLDAAFAFFVKERASGVLVLASAFFSSQAPRIASLAARNRLPAMYEHQGFIEAGGFMSYGPSHRDTFRRLAVYVDKILKGSKPAALPVEQPTKVELALNLKTAKALGLTMPQSLLGRADRVIE